ncbi:MAG: peptidylprolyl isomerase [Flavobacteriaceae bacterium]|nr:peptidylprolyl isomerase [Flavobacteriaceae bacterium]
MKMKQLFFGILLFLNVIGFAQNSSKEVLFTIDNKPYFTDEFVRVYKKNLDLVKDESQKELNNYLELFVGYKLKINKAYKLGLQNGTSYQNELKSYRTQLSKNYTSDSKVTKELVEEAYKRFLKEIKASHILFSVDENATPEDTLKAYKQALEVRKRAISGEDFGKLAAEFSQDPSAKDNKGDLGYFTAFRMVYSFETGAYKTSKGSISYPIRTRFGYHLIKVVDIRDNRGDVIVAHIMIMNPSEKSENTDNVDKGMNTIQDIYKKLQQGEKFEDLAKQFSDDKSSSNKGGVLNRFGSGQLSSEEFENVAFNLTKDNPISEPFKTQYGWHIVKLIDKFSVKSIDEMRSDLESKVSKDDRSRLITASMNEKLRKKYSIKRDDKFYSIILNTVSNDIYDGKWEIPSDLKVFNKNLVTINGTKSLTGSSFLNYVKEQQKNKITLKPITKLIDKFYQSYIDQELSQYYDDNLEKEFPEFSAVMDEYRDGLLLFDLMEKEIWNKSKTDTLGLKSFYDKNISNYQWKNRLDVIILSSTNIDIIKKASKYLKNDKSVDFIKEKLNSREGAVNIMAKAGIFEEGNEALPKNIKFETGISDIIKEGEYYFVTKINATLPAGPKLLDECKGKAINDYQQFLEDNWVKDLKNEFKIEINQVVFDSIKKQLKP